MFNSYSKYLYRYSRNNRSVYINHKFNLTLRFKNQGCYQYQYILTDNNDNKYQLERWLLRFCLHKECPSPGSSCRS